MVLVMMMGVMEVVLRLMKLWLYWRLGGCVGECNIETIVVVFGRDDVVVVALNVWLSWSHAREASRRVGMMILGVIVNLIINIYLIFNLF